MSNASLIVLVVSLIPFVVYFVFRWTHREEVEAAKDMQEYRRRREEEKQNEAFKSQPHAPHKWKEE